MFSNINKFYLRLISDDRGVTLVEYGIAIALAVTIGVTVLLPTLANDIGGAMSNAGNKMP
jgi:Flp pilus assembly pilin Flp